MNLMGLPDFARPFSIGEVNGYYNFGAPGLQILPSRVSIASNDNGLPKVTLELLRPNLLIANHKGYAILAAEFEPEYTFAAANEVLTSQSDIATVQACGIAEGCLYFKLPDISELGLAREPSSELSKELESTTPINPNLIDRQFMIKRLSTEAGVFWKQLILDGTLLLKAQLNYLIEGVSPRVNAQVRFESPALITELNRLIDGANQNSEPNDEGGAIPYDDLVELVCERIDELPVQLELASESNGDVPVPVDSNSSLYQCLVDRLLGRFATTSFSEEGELLCAFDKARDERGSLIRVHWDLSQPQLALRAYQIALSSFDAEGSLSLEQTQRLISERQLPFIHTNKRLVTVFGNLPELSSRVLAVQATIAQAAEPPKRPVAFQETLNLASDEAERSVYLHQNQVGETEYEVVTRLVVETNTGLLTLVAPATQSAERNLVLGPKSFAAKWIAVSLAQEWRAQYRVELELAFEANGERHVVSEALGEDKTQLMICLPEDCGEVSGRYDLIDPTLGRRASNTFEGLNPISITPFAFPQCGLQRISVIGKFNESQEPLMVEVQAVSSTERTAPISLIRLTPDQPTKTWQWFSHVPFEVSYRYRELDLHGEPLHDWRLHKYPFKALQLGRFKDQHVEPSVVTGSR